MRGEEILWPKMIEGETIQTLLQEGALPPRAALEAAAATCVALEAHAPVPGGRPLSAASVELDADGSAMLRDVEQADAMAIGSLLAHMLLGGMAPAEDTDALLERLDRALQQEAVDASWRRKLHALVRACRSPEPSSRPPIHRVRRRCADLVAETTGAPLRIILRQRAASTASWMDLPSASETAQLITASIPDMTQPQAPRLQPPEAAAPAPAPAPAPQRRAPLTPLPAAEPSRGPWWLVALMVVATLGVGGMVVAQMGQQPDTPPTHRADPAERSNLRAEVRAADALGFRLSIASEPVGAAVHIDGTLVGHTPTEAPGITAGVHQIRLVAGKETIEQTLMIDRDAACTWEPGGDEPWRCAAP